MPKLKVKLGIGISNAHQEDILDVDDDEYNACGTEVEKEKLLLEYWTDWMWDHVDGSHELID